MERTKRSAYALQFGGPRWREDNLDSPTGEQRLEAPHELGVAIDNQLLVRHQETIIRVREVAAYLRHERFIRRSRPSSDADATGSQIDHE